MIWKTMFSSRTAHFLLALVRGVLVGLVALVVHEGLVVPSMVQERLMAFVVQVGVVLFVVVQGHVENG